MADDVQNGEPGFRVTLGTVWTQQQSLERQLSDLRADFRVMQAGLEADRRERGMALAAEVLLESQRQKRFEKIEGRINSVLATLGTGVAVGLIAWGTGVLG